MKGIIFTEFTELVENTFGADMMDEIIEDTNPASQGAYTSVGSYDFAELAAMVQALSKRSGIEASDLLITFGKHLADTFSRKFTSFFIEAGTAIKFLQKVDDHIHVQVKKLYPDAQTPHVEVLQGSNNQHSSILYASKRPLADVAHGLILGICDYFGEKYTIERKQWEEQGMHFCQFELVAAK